MIEIQEKPSRRKLKKAPSVKRYEALIGSIEQTAEQVVLSSEGIRDIYPELMPDEIDAILQCARVELNNPDLSTSFVFGGLLFARLEIARKQSKQLIDAPEATEALDPALRLRIIGYAFRKHVVAFLICVGVDDFLWQYYAVLQATGEQQQFQSLVTYSPVLGSALAVGGFALISASGFIRDARRRTFG